MASASCRQRCEPAGPDHLYPPGHVQLLLCFARGTGDGGTSYCGAVAHSQAMLRARHQKIMLRFLFPCFGMLALLLGTSDRVAGHGPKEARDPSRADHPAAYLGGVVTPPLPKPKFLLTDTSNAPYDLWSKTQGYVTLLFFGYTRCSDECPLQMHNIASALDKVSTDVVEQIRVVFV